jgi:hypothetical protein
MGLYLFGIKRLIAKPISNRGYSEAKFFGNLAT